MNWYLHEGPLEQRLEQGQGLAGMAQPAAPRRRDRAVSRAAEGSLW
ncbi:hypothetical protein OHS70_00585 [Streptomyces sp. NBC_00390]